MSGQRRKMETDLGPGQQTIQGERTEQVTVRKRGLSQRDAKSDPGHDLGERVDRCLVEGRESDLWTDGKDPLIKPQGLRKDPALRRSPELVSPAPDPGKEEDLEAGPLKELRSLDQSRKILTEKNPSRRKCNEHLLPQLITHIKTRTC